MRTQPMLLCVAVALLGLILLEGCARPNKQLFYGTWVSEKGHIQKSVRTLDGEVDNYALTSDTAPFERSKGQIISCWLDSEGNTWFKCEGTITEGPYKNSVPKVQTLEKISKSGTSLEVMVNGVVEFNPKSFPTKIDPTDTEFYMAFTRAEK